MQYCMETIQGVRLQKYAAAVACCCGHYSDIREEKAIAVSTELHRYSSFFPWEASQPQMSILALVQY